MPKLDKILLISIVVSLMGLISSTKPSLSHSGDNNTPQLKQEEKQSEAQNKINQEIEKIEKTSVQYKT